MGHRYQLKTLGAFLVALTLIAGTGILDSAWSSTEGAAKKVGNKQIMQKVLKRQMPFIANQGQVKDQGVKFYAKTFSGAVYVTRKGEMIYSFPPALNPESEVGGQKPEARSQKSKGFVLKEILVGAKIAGLKGVDPSQAKVNYFIGNDKTKWKTNIPTFNEVSLGTVYEGIDLSLKAYGNNVEKIFTVHPGAEPKSIKLRMKGAKSLKINDKGELEAETGHGPVKFSKPIAFQEKNGKRENVQVAYQLEKDTYGFKAGNYERSRPLIIDPMLLYSTYLGGGSGDSATSVAVEGYAYVTGSTSSTDFPTAYPYQPANKGFTNVFVAKFDLSLSTLIYITYLGGSEHDYGTGVDAYGGRAYVTGYTDSIDFPTLGNAYQQFHQSGNDAFLTVLNPAGSLLSYSTYLGGNGDDRSWDIAVDNLDNACLTGWTTSTDFPTLNAYQPNNDSGGPTDAFVTKINPTLFGPASLIYSTYLGGTAYDGAEAVAYDASGNIYVTGQTFSTNFPVRGAYQSANAGRYDAFVTKINPSLSADASLLYSTYLGGSNTTTGEDSGSGIAVDASGNIYVTGYTDSYNDTTHEPFPTTANAYQATNAGGYDAFVSKIDPSQTGPDQLIYSTYLGSIGTFEYGLDIAVDTWGNIFVTGKTNSATFPTTANAYQTASAGGDDAFVVKINPSKIGPDQLRYSTYLGGVGGDSAYGIAQDYATYPPNEVYVVGSTFSTNFPTPHAYQNLNNGNGDAFVAKLWVGEFIDRTQWTNAEFIRRITNGALESVFTKYGASGGNSLSFSDYDAIDGIKARVKVTRVINDNAFSRARLAGFWYQAVSGDHIYAEIGIRPSDIGESPPLEVYYLVVTCADPTVCNTSTVLAEVPICTADLNKYYDLSIRWTGTGFLFECEYAVYEGPLLETIATEGRTWFPAASTLPDTTSPYTSPWKGIGTRVSDTGGAPENGGYIAAYFDDVETYPTGGTTGFSPYDSFSSGMIDRVNWREWEFVRHAENGVYESAITRYDTNGSNYLFFADAEKIKGFQADVTVTEMVNTTGAFPYARLAGAFYNDGSAGGGRAGDVVATVALAPGGGAGGLLCYCWLTRCTGGDCNLIGESETIYNFTFPEQAFPYFPYTLSVVWDETSNEFTFGFDGVYHVALLSPATKPPIAGPPLFGKGISTRVSSIDSNAESAYISATFDNVVVLEVLDTDTDTDGDGIPDVFDEDDDNDGLTDVEETALGTSSTNPDSDGDGLEDGDEVLLGTNPLGSDSDGDGVNDLDDLFPNDNTEWADFDTDLIGDNSDNCPLIRNYRTTGWTDINGIVHTDEQPDYDLDGIGNACDEDADDDGFLSPYTSNGDDCNDLDETIYPVPDGSGGYLCDGEPINYLAPKSTPPGLNIEPDPDPVCTGDDSDGDGVLLSCDSCPTTWNVNQQLPVWYKDADDDGYTDGNISPVSGCEAPADAIYKRAPGYDSYAQVPDPSPDPELTSLVYYDCDDNDGTINPAATDPAKDCDPNTQAPENIQPYNIVIDGDMTLSRGDQDTPTPYGSWEPQAGDTLTVNFDVTGLETGDSLDGDITFPAGDVKMTAYVGDYYNDDTGSTVDFDGLDLTGIPNQVSFTIKDYGGVISIKAMVTVVTPGGSIFIDKVFTFPKDSDGDDIPDFYEMQYGDLLPDADSDLDGINNRNEYRGVKWGRLEPVQPDAQYNTVAYLSVDVVEHIRTSPIKRTLFVKYTGYKDAANPNGMQFAIGEAFATLTNPVEVYALGVDKVTSEDRIDAVLVEYKNEAYGSENGHIRDLSSRAWTFSTLGASNGAGDEDSYVSCRVYQKAIDSLFAVLPGKGDRPYIDDATFSVAQPARNMKYSEYWSPIPDKILNPVGFVEDADDNGILGDRENKVDLVGEAGSSYPSPRLTGDHPVACGVTDPLCIPDPDGNGWIDNPWEYNHDLSPYNVDNDGKIELPQVAEMGQITSEYSYSPEQGVKHVTTHELGHATGIALHTNDSTCVMYNATDNFLRDGHFSAIAAENVRIHNQ